MTRSKLTIQSTAAAGIIETSSVRITNASHRTITLTDVAVMEDNEKGDTGI